MDLTFNVCKTPRTPRTHRTRDAYTYHRAHCPHTYLPPRTGKQHALARSCVPHPHTPHAPRPTPPPRTHATYAPPPRGTLHAPHACRTTLFPTLHPLPLPGATPPAHAHPAHTYYFRRVRPHTCHTHHLRTISSAPRITAHATAWRCHALRAAWRMGQQAWRCWCTKRQARPGLYQDIMGSWVMDLAALDNSLPSRSTVPQHHPHWRGSLRAAPAPCAPQGAAYTYSCGCRCAFGWPHLYRVLPFTCTSIPLAQNTGGLCRC